ncbi:MAG: hypothetical protein AAB393_13900 [Bacteroidota bacterium]
MVESGKEQLTVGSGDPGRVAEHSTGEEMGDGRWSLGAAVDKGGGCVSIIRMKTTDLTISELAVSVPKAVRETERLGIRGITKRGKAVAFLVSREVMESILETMELQKDSRLMDLVKADRAGQVAFTRVPVGQIAARR